MRFILGIVSWLFTLLLTGVVVAAAAGFVIFHHYSRDLPDYTQLSHYDPATVTRLYASDGKLLAEYATEKRVFVPLSAIPKRVIQAFLAAEDKNFYQHEGIDIQSIFRAVYTNIVNYGQGKSLVGGSTITQQVVKNFLLTDEKSLTRKIREAILALRVSQAYSKDKILELYLNEIFLGIRSYGVGAAALNYFNKPLEDLTIEEVALLAAQPKAPSNYDPRHNGEAAMTRRNWVIRRMMEDGYITPEEAAQAVQQPITLQTRSPDDVAHADFFAEEVRRWLAQQYGKNALYEGGLVVRTTLNPALQAVADQALRDALIAYDRRHGYRGPIAHVTALAGVEEKLKDLTKRTHKLLEDQRLAVVVARDNARASLKFADGSRGVIPLSLMQWPGNINKPGDLLSSGDIVVVQPATAEERKKLSAAEAKLAWSLQQIPQVNGALVAMDPHSGRVLALSGGYSYEGDEFNRATQAKRQPGSAFKPFVYMAGLEAGLTPSTLLLDAPVELSQGAGLPTWKPQNYEDHYLGPTTLRVGLEKSRNTMTVRLGQMIGIDRIINIGKRFGIYNELPRNFSIVLGAAETTLLQLTNAYCMVANGGKHVPPTLVERVDDRHGKIIYRRDARDCRGCIIPPDMLSGIDSPPPLPPDNREQVADPRIAYQMISILQGVVERGTGMRARVLNRPIGGKTGTTNESMDAWFVGFSPNLVTGVFIGYDKPQSLGKRETGASAALPAFIDFMQTALKDEPVVPFRIPSGIQFVRVDLKTGLPVTPENPGGDKIIQEAFIAGDRGVYVPGAEALPKRAAESQIIPPPPPVVADPPPVSGTGGLY